MFIFYHATDFGTTMQNLQITLTPGFDGRVWCTKNSNTKTLTIHGTSDEEVSYRFTANRFDWKDWSNLLVNATTTGLIVPEK